MEKAVGLGPGLAVRGESERSAGSGSSGNKPHRHEEGLTVSLTPCRGKHDRSWVEQT